MQEWRDIYYTSRDGLRLHARHYEALGSSRRPVVCLAGLTRNSRDFHDLAVHLHDPRGHRRNVYCLDYRGRGLSEHDPDWRNYSPYIELLDTLDFMALAGIHNAAIVGTSRGGLIAMIMATLRPTAIGAVVMNDIGPVIERDGLARIAGYVGRVPLPADWDEAGEMLRDMNRGDFPEVTVETWRAVARQWFNDDNGRPNAGYDPAISNAFSSDAMQGPLPEMWPQFYALSGMPLLLVRGENSDILSLETAQRMIDTHPNARFLEIKKQGHAPLLKGAEEIYEIGQFLIYADEQTAATEDD